MITTTQKSPASVASSIFTKYVGTIKVKPRAKQLMSLGNYSSARPAKGFSIALISPKDEAEVVTTDITTAGSSKRHEYMLHVDNHSNRTVQAEVWQI